MVHTVRAEGCEKNIFPQPVLRIFNIECSQLACLYRMLISLLKITRHVQLLSGKRRYHSRFRDTIIVLKNWPLNKLSQTTEKRESL